jgi:hypothetical protein
MKTRRVVAILVVTGAATYGALIALDARGAVGLLCVFAKDGKGGFAVVSAVQRDPTVVDVDAQLVAAQRSTASCCSATLPA